MRLSLDDYDYGPDPPTVREMFGILLALAAMVVALVYSFPRKE
jgi:hypothetical protein